MEREIYRYRFIRPRGRQTGSNNGSRKRFTCLSSNEDNRQFRPISFLIVFIHFSRNAIIFTLEKKRIAQTQTFSNYLQFDFRICLEKDDSMINRSIIIYILLREDRTKIRRNNLRVKITLRNLEKLFIQLDRWTLINSSSCAKAILFE